MQNKIAGKDEVLTRVITVLRSVRGIGPPLSPCAPQSPAVKPGNPVTLPSILPIRPPPLPTNQEIYMQ